jgi:hypothetical protein
MCTVRLQIRQRLIVQISFWWSLRRDGVDEQGGERGVIERRAFVAGHG